MQNVPHQVVQSPARLGLPNPNSPSLQNSTPPKLSSQAQQPNYPKQSNLSSISSTSSKLLPLLPPLPRAQSILLQMAFLASRLFEVSPNRSNWISALRGSLPSFLSPQTQSMTSNVADSSSPSSPKEIISLFATLQTQLFEAVAELQEILDLQNAKQKLSREIQAKDASLLAFANKLKEAERALDMLVDDYSYCRRQKRSKVEDGSDSSTTTIATHLKLSDILSYAHKISYTTFAPPEFGAGLAPLRGALPPAPQEEQMRASQLYNFADLDVGLPKTDVAKERMVEPLIEAPASQPKETNPLGNLAGIPGLLPNIVVPSGWKPGMPVELPTDIPLPPPGWKPGDPVPLPALDSLAMPPRVEDQLPRPVHPTLLSKPPEPIQVRHVQLDFDDDSSDESSDIGSSDSED